MESTKADDLEKKKETKTEEVVIDKSSLASATCISGSAFSLTSRKVVRLTGTGRDDIAVKIGRKVNMVEAESMKFVREWTSIPVPRVLNAYYGKDDGYGYIVMEFVQGEMLRTAWPKLTRNEKDVILSELRDYMDQLRRLEPPRETMAAATATAKGAAAAAAGAAKSKENAGNDSSNSNPSIQSVTGGPVADFRAMGAVQGGPFATEADFNAWQLQQLQPNVDTMSRDIYTAMHRTDHRIVFSHGDYGPHNVLVRDGHVAAVIDWEFAGWFPEHWDYCKAAGHFCDTPELYDGLKRIFEKHYFAEHMMDMWFTKEVKHGGF